MCIRDRDIVLLGGFRYEKTKNWYKKRFGEITVSDEGDLLASTAQDTVGTLSYDDFLPMVHLRYNVTEWADLRLGYTNTITRPDYQNLVPREKIDTDAREIFRGQPYICLLYTSPSPRDRTRSRMPSSA